MRKAGRDHCFRDNEVHKKIRRKMKEVKEKVETKYKEAQPQTEHLPLNAISTIITSLDCLFGILLWPGTTLKHSAGLGESRATSMNGAERTQLKRRRPRNLSSLDLHLI